MNTVFVSLDVACSPLDMQVLDEVECARCGAILDIHQPDEQLPARLLGACPNCRAWHLIDVEAGLMVILPDEAELRCA
jgi:hypothetical protein